MQINIKVLIVLFSFVACALCACKKNHIEEEWAKEEAKLAKWMKENKPDALLINGIYFEKTGSKYPDNIQPEANDYVLANFICRFLYDGVVENASYKNYPGVQSPSLYREGGPELWSSDMWESMGIGQLREKEHAKVYIPSRILSLQDFKPRVFDIDLEKVIDTDLKNYQEKLMSKCMKSFHNNVDTITIQMNGKDYYVIYHVDKGKGDDVDVSSVKTHYTESYYLQEGDPRICVTNKEKIGWDKKFSEMFHSVKKGSVKKGGKITAVMPYRIMYGEEPYTDNNKQRIAPLGSVLKYDISIDQ